MKDIVNQNRENAKRIILRILVILLFPVFAVAGFGAGLYYSGKSELVKNLAKKEAVYLGKITGKYSQPEKGTLAEDIDFKLFWKVWDALKKDYVDKNKLNEKEMFYGAIHGMVASADDPYTVFMDPKISQEFADDLAGTFEGIGAEIGIRKNILTVIAPLPGSPAEKAGLRAADKILAIDGKITAGITVEEAVGKIRGQGGTEVKLTIMRDGFEKAKDLVIVRDKIVVKSVSTEEKEGFFIIKISNFNNDTESLFKQAVAEIVKKNPRGVILDLRNDPGGYLETAISVASEWIQDNVIVSEKFGDDNKNDFLAKGRARLKDYKTAVLVNEGSASASEIVAGALKDYGKAILIGKQTFGKGSVQTLNEFSDGSSLKVTVAKWLTPKGVNISEQGIKPDIDIELTEKDYDEGKDPQMAEAVRQLKNKK